MVTGAYTREEKRVSGSRGLGCVGESAYSLRASGSLCDLIWMSVLDFESCS